MADPPVQERRKHVSDRIRRTGLKPALPTFRAIAATGERNALIASSRLTNTYPCQHEQLAVLLSQGLQCCFHRLYLQLWCTPAKAVLRCWHTTPEQIHEKAVIQSRKDNLRLDAFRSQFSQDRYGGGMERWKFHARIGIKHGQAFGRWYLACFDEMCGQCDRSR